MLSVDLNIAVSDSLVYYFQKNIFVLDEVGGTSPALPPAGNSQFRREEIIFPPFSGTSDEMGGGSRDARATLKAGKALGFSRDQSRLPATSAAGRLPG
jgi:hypothetical protein